MPLARLWAAPGVEVLAGQVTSYPPPLNLRFQVWMAVDYSPGTHHRRANMSWHFAARPVAFDEDTSLLRGDDSRARIYDLISVEPYPMKRTTVVHRSQPHDVFIGRGGKWGNPFPITRVTDRAAVIAKYKAWLPTQTHLMESLHELRGQRLGCFCAPLPCHGDVLAELANALNDPCPACGRTDHDPQAKFYVSVVRNGGAAHRQTIFAAGPFDDHLAAVRLVDVVRSLAIEGNPWHHFDAFGTCAISPRHAPNWLPTGLLNEQIMVGQAYPKAPTDTM